MLKTLSIRSEVVFVINTRIVTFKNLQKFVHKVIPHQIHKRKVIWKVVKQIILDLGDLRIWARRY